MAERIVPDSPLSPALSPASGGEGVAAALAGAAARLAGGSDTARLDAELLMAHALGVEREAMLLSWLDAAAPAAFEGLVRRRLTHEPVAFIVGWRAFWSIGLSVGRGVLVPRPDSETLIEAAVDHFGERGPATILDLGTGPGTLLLASLSQWPNAHGLGIDSSERALEFAELNAIDLELEGRARFRVGDWARGLDGQFDLILCNPPYVEQGADLPREVADWEPDAALYAGPDGLDAYRRLAPEVPRLLAPDGVACFEIGAGQAEAAGALFEAEGLHVSLRKDLGGRDRCLILRR
ncbi:MAG TPA: peptide chain release factor N(5)-glutamine methyltransferase [Allosphingosinicella sp.]|nr:peptide chain release factor N(5)-glutamine methyltransferase [Allosphingosinicella sp.]